MISVELTSNLAILLLTSWLVIGNSESGDSASEPLARCQARNKSETICVLKTEADKYLEWTWFENSNSLARNSSTNAGGSFKNILDGSLRLDIGKSAYSLNMDKLRANLRVSHGAKIFFPFYPITTSDRCEFSFSYRVNERSSYVASATEKPTQNDPNYHWPKVSVVLIRPTSEEPHNSSENKPVSLAQPHLLSHFEPPGSYLANEFDSSLLIGRQMAGSWSLAILIETRLDANLLEFTRMKLINCEPTGGEMAAFAQENKLRELIDLEQAFATTCTNAREQFQCRLSGRCLSLDYRCDFGQDCGPLDDSDEFRCSVDFEGRCDFEENSDLCQWVTLPRGDGNSWTRTSVADEHTTIVHKPPLDHSLQRADQGHYLLLGVHQLDGRQSMQLIGPRVQLKAGHPDCKFRFWVYVPACLRSTSLNSTSLTVGYERIGPTDLFGEAGAREHREENNWRRFQVTLFNERLIYHNVSLFALHITFGNFSNDLELLSLGDAYLALDDFSFSSGCALTFYDKSPTNICGDTEFECDLAPPKVPKQICIPSNRVCDFKNDCGHYEGLYASGWSLSAASDEAHCMSWFDVDRSSSFVGLELSGIQVVNHNIGGGNRNWSKFSAGPELNEALELELPELNQADGRKLKPFKFRAQYEKFMMNFRDPSERMRHVTETGILLPRFHQAHANCRLSLTYAWDRNSQNLLASIYVIRSDVSTLYRRWSCRKDLNDRQANNFSLSFGLGEQNSPFRVLLKVSVESFENDSDVGGHKFSGWFSLMSYSFESCAHLAGQVSVPQAQIVPIGDLDEGDEDSDYEDEYRHESIEAATRANELLLQCPETQFQCRQPILCLDERLVCDKQRDCQESGADEIDCAARGFIQYDFEDNLMLEGWWPSPEMVEGQSEGNSSVWSVMNSAEFGARNDPSLPPVDHTLGRASGHYLSLHVNRWTASDETQIAPIVTPTFDVLDTCKSLVLYIYETSEFGQPAHSFSVIYFDNLEQYLIDEIALEPNEMPATDRVDSWRRLEFGLPHAYGCQKCRKARRFSIGIHRGRDLLGSSIRTPKLVIDDMTLGLKCQLSTQSTNQNHHSHVPKKTTSESSPWFWYRLIGFMILAVGCCSTGLLVYMSRFRRSAEDERSVRREENYLALDQLD